VFHAGDGFVTPTLACWTLVGALANGHEEDQLPAPRRRWRSWRDPLRSFGGWNLMSESRKGFPADSPRASLRHANRDFLFCHSRQHGPAGLWSKTAMRRQSIWRARSEKPSMPPRVGDRRRGLTMEQPPGGQGRPLIEKRFAMHSRDAAPLCSLLPAPPWTNSHQAIE
jgi:hypothetical protein